jgi:hypothetical protein
VPLSDIEKDQLFRKYAWDYFAVHAAQRLTTFQFYITLCTALVGGYLVLIANKDTRSIAWVIGVLLMLLSHVFYKLDVRTRELIKNAERALDRLDAAQNLPEEPDGSPNRLRVIAVDDFACASAKKQILFGRYSYSKCFRVVFVCFGIIGVFASIYAASTTTRVPEETGKYSIEIEEVANDER